MLAIVGQRTCEFVGPCLAAFLLSHLAELSNARSHGPHIVQRIADHVGHVSNRSLASSFIEALQADVTVYNWALHEEHILFCHHVVELANRVKHFRRSGTKLRNVG